jgi:hypothetical protein
MAMGSGGVDIPQDRLTADDRSHKMHSRPATPHALPGRAMSRRAWSWAGATGRLGALSRLLCCGLSGSLFRLSLLRTRGAFSTAAV